MSVKKTIIVSMVLFATVPIVAMTIFIGVAFIQNMERIELNRLQSVALSNGFSIEKNMEKQFYEVELLANHYLVYTLSNDGVSAIDNLPEQLDRYFQRIIGDGREYSNIVLIGQDGYVLKSYQGLDVGTDLSGEPYFVSAMTTNGIYNGNYLLSTDYSHEQVAPISHAVVNEDGAPIGVMTLFVKMPYIAELMNAMQFDKDGIMFLVGQDGEMVYNPTPESIDYQDAKTVLADLRAQYEKGTEPQAGQFIHTGHKHSYVLSYYFFSKQPWAFVMMFPLGSITTTRYMIIGSMILFALFSFWVAVRISSWLAQRIVTPLTGMIEAFDETKTNGRYPKLAVQTQNEFGELSQHYNNMVEVLNRSYNELTNSYKENEYIANYDLLTGFVNRTECGKRLEKIIQNKKPFYVLIVDLDDFKDINEVYGHTVGNELLLQFSKRLETTDLHAEVYARTGGDEFYLIIPGVLEKEELLVQQLENIFEPPFSVRDIEIYVTGSMGVAQYPADGDSVATLNENAEIAMYRAKATGKNKLCMFNNEMREQIAFQTRLKEILRHSVASGELSLIFQPEVDIRENRVMGFESLMRLDSKTFGKISPEVFIPIAESSGLIVQLGYWILEESCLFAKRTLEAGYSFEGISVNVSVAQLIEKDFVDNVLRLLEKVGLPPNRLILEITESMLMRQMSSHVAKLEQLRAYGVQISVDDFGMSYSSLSYLIHLPIDFIKIDKSFVDDICTNTKKQVIIQAIIHISHELGYRVITEGVETAEQCDWIRKAGCDIVQGYFYSKPLVEHDAQQLLGRGLDSTP